MFIPLGQGVAGASTGFLTGGPPEAAPSKVTHHVAPRVHEKPILRPHHRWHHPNIRIRVLNDNENFNREHRRHHDRDIKREDVKPDDKRDNKRDNKRDDKRDERPYDDERDWFEELFEDALR
jgi:hypothetical protein